MELSTYSRVESAEDTWLRVKEDDDFYLGDISLSFPSNRSPRPGYIIADTDLAELGRDIGRNTKLTFVKFDRDYESYGQDSTNATLERLQTVCEGINQNRSITHLDFGGFGGSFITCAARTLSHFLEHNDKLLEVGFLSSQFDEESIRQLFAPIARRKRPLFSFYLRFCGTTVIDDRSFVEMIGHFLENPDRTPFNFNLGFNIAQSSVKLTKINELLKKTNCSIMNLTFPFSRGSLEYISQTLCDDSSINSTYYSNHTLERITAHTVSAFEPHLQQSLKLNRNPDKKLVALQKVVMCHFGHQFQIEPFVGMPPDLLLRFIEFLDNAATQKDDDGNTIIHIESCNRLSLLFQLVRDNPLGYAKGGEGESLDGALIGDVLGSTDIEPECNLFKRQRLL